MPTNLSLIARRRHLRCGVAIMAALAAPLAAPAQQAEDNPAPAAVADAATVELDTSTVELDTGPVEDQVDPLTVPDNATAAELFEFIDSVKQRRGYTVESVSRAAQAVAVAAQAIRELEQVELQAEILAIREQLGALGFLQRVDRQSSAQLLLLIDRLRNDGRAAIARIGAIEAFKISARDVRRASKQRKLQIIAELKSLLAEHQFDRDSFAVATGLARAIGCSEHAEVAAALYEDLARWTSASSDKALQVRADKMLGAARRMRLPGHPIEVTGSTAAGEEFDWDAYRGKVVLVDFWASWCVRCRAEFPNMKRNLAAYQDRGFEIVGVNLDRALETCQDFVQQQGLPWINLISLSEGELGWNNPLAAYYGISEIPTAILVDQQGLVVSLNARGDDLDRWLEQLLGPPAGRTNPEPTALAADAERGGGRQPE